MSVRVGSHRSLLRGGMFTGRSSLRVGDVATRGFRTFTDALSLRVFGTDYGTTVTGSGTSALETNPDAGHVRDKLLAFTVTGAGDTAYVRETVQYFPFNGDVESSTISDTTLTNFHWRAELLVTGGSGTILIAYDASGVERYRMGYAASGAGFKLTLNGVAKGRELAYNKMLNLRLSADSLGNFTLSTKVRDESVYTAEFAGTDTVPGAVRTICWGIPVAASAGKVMFSDISNSDLSFAEIDRNWYIAGSGCRDISQNNVSLALFCPDGFITGQNKARVRWAVGTDPADVPGGTATAFVSLAGRASSILKLPVNGLTHNSRYVYRFEVADASGTVLWSSEVYQLRTLADAGTVQAGQFALASCYMQTPPAHPYADEQYVLDSALAEFLGVINLGDQGYEIGGPPELVRPYMDGKPAQTKADFEKQIREFCCDIVLHKVFLRGMYFCTPDDHQVRNMVDARYAPGGSLANTKSNALPGDRSNGTYDDSTTASVLWVNGLGVFADWFSDHWLDKPSAGVLYKSWTNGCVQIALLDTRFERNAPAGLYISATQLSWYNNWSKAAASGGARLATTGLMITLAQSGIAENSTKGNEGWGESDTIAQYRVAMDTRITNLAGTPHLDGTGDDHLLYALHKIAATVVNPNFPPGYLGEVRASGGSEDALIMTYTASWKLGQEVFTHNRSYVRGSPVMLKIGGSGESVRLGCYALGTERTYSAQYPIGASGMTRTAVIYDSFTKADNTVIAGSTPDTGSVWVQAVGGGQRVISNRLQLVGANSSGSVLRSSACAANSYAEAGMVRGAATSTSVLGVGVRFNAAGTEGYEWVRSVNNAQFRIRKRKAGAPVQKAFYANTFDSSTKVPRLEAYDNPNGDVVLIGYLDDVVVATFLDDEADKITAAGYSTLVSSNTTANPEIYLEYFEAGNLTPP